MAAQSGLVLLGLHAREAIERIVAEGPLDLAPTCGSRSTRPEAFPHAPPLIRHRRPSEARCPHDWGCPADYPGGVSIVSTGAGGCVDGASRPRTSDAIRSVAPHADRSYVELKNANAAVCPRALRSVSIWGPGRLRQEFPPPQFEADLVPAYAAAASDLFDHA